MGLARLDFARVTLEKPANVAIPMALFYALSPDAFLSFPGIVAALQETSLAPLANFVPTVVVNQDRLATHTLAFGLAYALLRYNFPQFY